MSSGDTVQPLHVAVATDAGYLPWCATVLRSCFEQHPEGLNVSVLHEARVPIAGLDRLHEIAEGTTGAIDLIPVDTRRLEGLAPKPRFGGYTALLRLLLPELVPELPRVIYLDVDTLVVDHLGPLWRTDLEGNPIAAVGNVVEPAMYDHLASLGIDDPRECLNSGVLVIDLDAVRAERSFDETIEALSSIANAPWFDQDALNVVFKKRWTPLHPRWNAMNSLWIWSDWANATYGAELVSEALRSPAVVHFEGPALVKPWHYLCSHPWLKRYRDTLARTPWAGTPVQGRTISTRFIRRLPSRWRMPALSRLQGVKRLISGGRPR